MKNSFILKFLIILISLCLFNCDEAIRMQQEEAIRNSINNSNYFKDKRTNICFVFIDLGSDGQAITSIPCTVEVEKLLK